MIMHLRRSRFPSICAKLEKRKYSPFRMTWKISDNAYVLQLPDDYNISHMFNVLIRLNIIKMMRGCMNLTRGQVLLK